MGSATLVSEYATLMGSPFTIQAYVRHGREENEIRRRMQLAFGEVRRIEDLLTDYRTSPFNRINEMAGIAPVKVCREILDILQFSLRISRDSDGAFDISYASVGHIWRESMKSRVPPTSEVLEHARKFVNYREIRIDEGKSEVYLPFREMRIGLGGVGKGYAVDQAFNLLNGMGLENFMVNGAGDIRLHSSASAPRSWRIAIRNPFAGRDVPMGYLELKQGAMATSGDYERFFVHQGEKYHHVLDGRTGDITQQVASVTILSPTALEADVCATTVMALGPEEGMRFLNRRRKASGFLVTPDGTVSRTDNLKSGGVSIHDSH